MRNEWVLFKEVDVGVFGVESSLPQFQSSSRHLIILPALRQGLSCISKLAGALLSFFSPPSNIKTTFPHTPLSNPFPFTQLQHKLMVMDLSSQHGPFFFHTFSTFFKWAHNLQSLPFLSLAAPLIPPFHLASNMLPFPPHNADIQMLGSLNQTPCNVKHRDCVSRSFPDLSCVRHAVEPRTGIQFPGILNNIFAKENQSNLSSEVLVGTGSRTMTIFKFKSLKVYAFGFYVQPFSLCQKLGPKYAFVPIGKLQECHDFYEDLLREDIGMTVRLVVNCSGMKINSVKDAFEKSLRARLFKTNPETDFKCISTFGSYFTKDIPLPAGTIIDFKRTADGQLITEIGGNQIGAVHSRELCMQGLIENTEDRLQITVQLYADVNTFMQGHFLICILERFLSQSKQRKRLGETLVVL